MRRKGLAELAWDFFRNGGQQEKGPADVVIVFRVRRNENGTFDADDWTAKHWLPDVGVRLPPGIPYAITEALTVHSVDQTLGKKAGTIAGTIVAEAASEIIGRVIGNRPPK